MPALYPQGEPMSESGPGLPAAASWPEEGAWPAMEGTAAVSWPDHQEVETVHDTFSRPALRLVDELGPDDDLPLDDTGLVDLRGGEDVP